MPKSKLTWYKSKANRIIKVLKAEPQKELATAINESQQVISYRLKNVYPEFLEDMIRLLDVCGYEIVEKGE